MNINELAFKLLGLFLDRYDRVVWEATNGRWWQGHTNAPLQHCCGWRVWLVSLESSDWFSVSALISKVSFKGIRQNGPIRWPCSSSLPAFSRLCPPTSGSHETSTLNSQTPTWTPSRACTSSWPEALWVLDPLAKIHRPGLFYLTWPTYLQGACLTLPSVPGLEVKVMLLLYSNRKKQFMGLIPHDQNGFINTIRGITNKNKERVGNRPGEVKQMHLGMLRAGNATLHPVHFWSLPPLSLHVVFGYRLVQFFRGLSVSYSSCLSGYMQMASMILPTSAGKSLKVSRYETCKMRVSMVLVTVFGRRGSYVSP